MPRRTAEALKAIAVAWANEQELVKEGKGTRDWTPKQQQDILERGKAYDDEGRAFEGQHMRSVAKYPDYQGDPKNIQFLTKDEHLAAHDGDWHNPTNWYYDPVTKIKYDFGDGPIIPCKVIDLSQPICRVIHASDENKNENKEEPIEKRFNTVTSQKKLKKWKRIKKWTRFIEIAGNVCVFFAPAFGNATGTFVSNSLGLGTPGNGHLISGVVHNSSTNNNRVISTMSDKGNTLRTGSIPTNPSTNVSATENTHNTEPTKNMNYPETRKPPKPHPVNGYDRTVTKKDGSIVVQNVSSYSTGKNHPTE